MTWCEQTPFDRDRDRYIRAFVLQNTLSAPCGIGFGYSLQGQRQRLDDEIIDRQAHTIGSDGFIHTFSGGQQLIQFAINGQIEMRNG